MLLLRVNSLLLLMAINRRRRGQPIKQVWTGGEAGWELGGMEGDVNSNGQHGHWYGNALDYMYVTSLFPVAQRRCGRKGRQQTQLERGLCLSQLSPLLQDK